MMPTTTKARAPYYSPEHLGRRCVHCGLQVVRAVGFHPACGPEAREIYTRCRRQYDDMPNREDQTA